MRSTEGGFGKTFKAVDEYQSHKPLCVIKQFAFGTDNPRIRQTALDLFYDEAKYLESLGKHEQIPELYAYFDIAGQPYLVQQFIDGQDLQQELAAAGRFDRAKIRELLLSLLPVLDFLHHQSPPVIHRDIKPANIIRRHSDGKLVLVDFGAAKQATQTIAEWEYACRAGTTTPFSFGDIITHISHFRFYDKINDRNYLEIIFSTLRSSSIIIIMSMRIF